MSIEGARRLMETTDAETVNQYLRFGWKLINQHLVEATPEAPARMQYVLGSFRSLDDTKELATLYETAAVNDYLALGWKLIDKVVTSLDHTGRRQETIHFVVAWQDDNTEPVHPGTEAARMIAKLQRDLAGEIELESE